MQTYTDNYDAALKIAGDDFADIVHLWHWSTNCELPTPWAFFLDIIGYSEENYGQPIYNSTNIFGQFIDLDYVADALKLWAVRPNDVRRIIDVIETGNVDDED
jgi:hypothetical protein